MTYKETFTKKELARQLWLVSQGAFEFGSPWKQDQFLADITNPASLYFLECVADQVIGYLVCHVVLDEAEIINIAVLPEYKGKGIANSLMIKAITSFGEKGIGQVFLEVREKNEPARQLYEKVGFVTIGRRKKYYQQPTEDGLVMQLELND